MNLVIDQGNTHIKIGFFESFKMRARYIFEGEEGLWLFLKDKKFDHVIVSSVVQSSHLSLAALPVHGHLIKVSAHTPLPLQIEYTTINTLGSDRIAIACGAVEQAFRQNCLAISMGTCVTFDVVSAEAVYHGGAISPGIKMRYQALCAFTSKLPLLAPQFPTDLVGNSTEECIHSGIIGGLLAEIEHVISLYRARYSRLHVIVCGGDMCWVEGKLRGDVSLVPDLTLIGLNKILLYNIDV